MSLFAVSTNDLLSSALVSSSGSAEGGVNVDADATIVVHVVLFLVLLAALKPLLFDPMLKLFEERELRTEGAKKKAAEEDKKTAESQDKYNEGMTKARAEGNVERDKLRGAGLKTETEILAKSRADAQATLEQGRARVLADADAARKALEIEATNLGRDLATRVLGREVRG